MSDRIEELEGRVAKLEGIIAKLASALGSSGASGSAGDVASDHDLDGKYGDPSVRKDPPRWKGITYVGKHFSECEVGYLEEMAGFLDWRAIKEEAKPEKAKYAKYSRADAARARGWAKRISDGWKPPKRDDSAGLGDPGGFDAGGFGAPDDAYDGIPDDEIPF
jgi:hypothetical protein